MKRTALFLAALAFASAALADSRIASDFEITEAKRQLARQHDPLDQIAARLNLGDLYMSRQQTAAGRENFNAAVDLAMRLRERGRKASDLELYSIATGYLGLAEAELGSREGAFSAFEEALRYSADDAKTWNLYSSAMSLVGLNAKATAAASNAVRIAEKTAEANPSVGTLLDLGIYRYTLASALIDQKREKEATASLNQVIAALEDRRFDGIRREVAGREEFEIFSIVRGDTGAYLSLLNRARLRLAGLQERTGDLDAARAGYGRVLAERNDDSTALEAMARLTSGEKEKDRYFVASFDANPFSLDLIREYDRWLAIHPTPAPDPVSPGAKMRRALIAASEGNPTLSDRELSALSAAFPGNETITFLEGQNALSRGDTGTAQARLATLRGDARAALEALILQRASLQADVPRFLSRPPRVLPVRPSESELASLQILLARNALTPGQKSALDGLTFVSTATFDDVVASEAGTTSFEQGALGAVHFKFSAPVAFRGAFEAHQPLTLTYAIVGGSGTGESAVLVIEAQGVSR